MPRAQTRCSGISSSEQGTSFPLVLQHASLCDRHDFDSIIADLAGARSARHGGRRARTGADRLGNPGTSPRRCVPGRATHAAIAGSRLEIPDTGDRPFSCDPRAFLSLVMPSIERASRHET
jgi:hypothetical protein